MTHLVKKRAGLMAVGMTCLLAGLALAQQFTPGQQPGTATSPGQAQRGDAASDDVNRYLASCWQANNEAEIEISRLAQQRAQNPQVKDFAQRMVQEHSQLSQKLQPLARGQNTAPGQPGTPGAQPGTIGANGANQANSQAIDRLAQIDRQIVERRSEMMKQELEEKSGAEFDQCYINGQVACHMGALAALEVVAQQTTGQLQQAANQAKQTVEQHLQQAKQLAQQVDRSGGRDAARQQTGAIRDRNLQPAGAQSAQQ